MKLLLKIKLLLPKQFSRAVFIFIKTSKIKEIKIVKHKIEFIQQVLLTYYRKIGILIRWQSTSFH